MRRASFAIGTAFQQSSLPFSAFVGIALGDRLSWLGWAGVAVATVGLAILSWPQGKGDDQGGDRLSAAAFGLGAGAAFGVSINAFRIAAHAAAPADPVFAAALAVVFVQFLQTAGLGFWLVWRDPRALSAALKAGPRAWGAGLCGAVASVGWFTAAALAPAAAVRAVGVVDIPMAAFAGRRLFAERLGWREIFGAVLTALGVIATAFAIS
jgi:hypothetical protein